MIIRIWGALWRTVLGAALCWFALTSLIALGWLLRDMARETRIALRRRDGLTRGEAGEEIMAAGLLLGEAEGRRDRWLGGLWANIRRGLAGGLALLAAGLVFGAPMMLAWWAGWNNSFHKGYEGAPIGPLVFAAAMLTGAVVLALAPMAIAHMAWSGRAGALFEIRATLRLIARAPMAYLLLSLGFVLAALPLFAFRAIPAFIEGIAPGFADLGAEAQRMVGLQMHAVACLYLFASLWTLRRWSARIYARAALRIGDAQAAALAGVAASTEPGLSRVGAAFYAPLLLILWLTVPILTLAGQFLNHSWPLWALHPFLAPPWTPAPG